MRRSACAEASLRAEIERMKKMSAEERILAALHMGEIFNRFQNVSEPKDGHGRK